MKITRSQLVFLCSAVVPMMMIFMSGIASATPTDPAPASLPWQDGLGALATALTGTTARYISMIAIFIAGIALIFGEDLGGFAKKLLMVVIAMSFLVGAATFFNTFSPLDNAVSNSASGALF